MWIVYGAWAWLIASSLVVFKDRGDVAAANHALPGLLFVLILHAGVWLYQKNRRTDKNPQPNKESLTQAIDDSIYDQVAAELSINQIHAGLMARAIAEADGDKDKTQAIYIKLRVAAIAAEQEQARKTEADERAHESNQTFQENVKADLERDPIKEDFFQDAVKRGEGDRRESKPSAERVWGVMFAHRAGLVILWYLVVSFSISVFIPFIELLKIEQLTNQDIGRALFLASLYGGFALLSYLGTQKLKW